jgi:hypothetical protein
MPDEPESLILQHLRLVRSDIRDVRTLALALAESHRRLEQRMGQLEGRIDVLKDDLELMIKAELMGRLGNFEIAMDRKFDTLTERVAALEGPGAR